MTALTNLGNAETQINSIGQTKLVSTQVNLAQEKVYLDTLDLPTLQMGQAGEAVRFLQQRLQAFEYHITFNGQFGLQIDAAVKHFQDRYCGLLVDGIVGPQTWKALCENFYPYGYSFYSEFFPTTYAYDVHMPTLQEGTDGNAVEFLQWLLQAAGYHLEVDGIFGHQTRLAVESYQTQAGLVVDGIVSYQTWREIGL